MAVTDTCIICNVEVPLPEYDAHCEGCLVRLINFSVGRARPGGGGGAAAGSPSSSVGSPRRHGAGDGAPRSPGGIRSPARKHAAKGAGAGVYAGGGMGAEAGEFL